jgi:hypothetical protein
MKSTYSLKLSAAVLLMSAAAAPATWAQTAAPAPANAASAASRPALATGELPKNFSFFVTSESIGQGANLGGLAGADAHCQKLAAGVGAGGRSWRAYLSAQAADGQPAVNARDRIGSGPWVNARGAVVARDLAHLHGDTLELAQLGNNLTRATVFTEKGGPVKGFGDQPNQHDILTGSQPDGRAYTDGADHSCRNYTSSGEGSAQLGHFDRTGGGNTSWNSAHRSRGCSQENLVATGGAGLLYCFATN